MSSFVCSQCGNMGYLQKTIEKTQMLSTEPCTSDHEETLNWRMCLRSSPSWLRVIGITIHPVRMAKCNASNRQDTSNFQPNYLVVRTFTQEVRDQGSGLSSAWGDSNLCLPFLSSALTTWLHNILGQGALHTTCQSWTFFLFACFGFRHP